METLTPDALYLAHDGKGVGDFPQLRGCASPNLPPLPLLARLPTLVPFRADPLLRPLPLCKLQQINVAFTSFFFLVAQVIALLMVGWLHRRSLSVYPRCCPPSWRRTGSTLTQSSPVSRHYATERSSSLVLTEGKPRLPSFT